MADSVPTQTARPATGVWPEIRLAWPILAAVILSISLCTLPNYAFGVFVTPIARYFATGPTPVTAWGLFWSMGCIAVAPFIGGLADRYGADRVIVLGMPVYGLAILGTALLSSTLWLFLAGAIVIGATSTTVSAMACGRLVSSHFDRGLGTALGLMSCGIGLSAIFGPILMQQVIDAFGWRTGFAAIAVSTFVATPLLWKLTASRQAPVRQTKSELFGLTLRQALRSPAFWLLALATFAFGLSVSGPSTNMVVYLVSTGLARPVAAGLVGGYGLFTVAGRILTGGALDRLHFHVAKTMAVAMSILTLAYLLIGYTPVFGMAVGLALFGFFLGAEVDCLAYCTVRLFGRRAFGSIYGVLGLCMLHVGIGSGPVVFSATATALDSYPTTFAIWSVIALTGGVAFLAVARAPYLPTPAAAARSAGG